MTANPGDGTDLVERALGECEMAFEKGVHSFHAGGLPSDLQIRPGVIEGVKDWLREPFRERLGGDEGPERWAKEGPRVRRTGFYAGALTAFRAYADNSEWVEDDHAVAAMEYIREHCKHPDTGIRYFYCP